LLLKERGAAWITNRPTRKPIAVDTMIAHPSFYRSSERQLVVDAWRGLTGFMTSLPRTEEIQESLDEDTEE